MYYIQVYRVTSAGKFEHSVLMANGRTSWRTKAIAVKHSNQFNGRHDSLVSEVVRE
jgi:hypothetical protein